MWWHLHALLHQLYVLVDTHHRAVVLHVDMLLADRLDETDLARSACRCGRNEGAVQVCRCSARPADLAEALAQTVHQRERDGSLAHMLPYRRHEERPRHCSSRGALKRSLASIGCCPIGWFSGVAQTSQEYASGRAVADCSSAVCSLPIPWLALHAQARLWLRPERRPAAAKATSSPR